ncbi:hypothetical protein SPAR74_0549 [Streptococcus pneumoniae GA41688]|nr:hypothetical protein SPAR74_0549 [Streptococcus pneumoniae GA41688]EHZ24311.1 hypothetical protein SPAR33_0596 [Streptococcus pneumoniae GA13723]
MYDFHFFSETVAIITFESHKIKNFYKYLTNRLKYHKMKMVTELLII